VDDNLPAYRINEQQIGKIIRLSQIIIIAQMIMVNEYQTIQNSTKYNNVNAPREVSCKEAQFNTWLNFCL